MLRSVVLLVLAGSCVASKFSLSQELVLKDMPLLSKEDDTSFCYGLSTVDIDIFKSRVNVSVNTGSSVYHIYSNGWPDHAYGPFPSKHNPNTIQTTPHHFGVARCPVMDPSGGSCLPVGPIGVAVNGIPLFNPFNIDGEVALEKEVMDRCDGHPDNKGTYHYHGHPGCIDSGGPDTLIGVAYDGIPILGPYDSNGQRITNDQLDECHGETLPDGSYRYRMTFEYPYILGCFKGEVPDVIKRKQSRENCYFATPEGIYKRDTHKDASKRYKRGAGRD